MPSGFRPFDEQFEVSNSHSLNLVFVYPRQRSLHVDPYMLTQSLSVEIRKSICTTDSVDGSREDLIDFSY